MFIFLERILYTSLKSFIEYVPNSTCCHVLYPSSKFITIDNEQPYGRGPINLHYYFMTRVISLSAQCQHRPSLIIPGCNT